MEESRTHLDMFVAAVNSPAMNDTDVTELYDLILRDHESSDIVPLASQEFQRKRPAAMMDYCRSILSAQNDDDCRMLMRQLDDPEVEDESVATTLQVLRDKLRDKHYIAAFALAVQLRPAAIRLAYHNATGPGKLMAVGLMGALLALFEEFLEE
jgi:hypothetical protein